MNNPQKKIKNNRLITLILTTLGLICNFYLIYIAFISPFLNFKIQHLFSDFNQQFLYVLYFLFTFLATFNSIFIVLSIVINNNIIKTLLSLSLASIFYNIILNNFNILSIQSS